jgi:hypothetical protein
MQNVPKDSEDRGTGRWTIRSLRIQGEMQNDFKKIAGIFTVNDKGDERR